MKLNWKAIGLGAAVAFIIAVVLVMSMPSLSIISAVIGGFVAAWYGKIKDFKDSAINGGLAGTIEYVIVLITVAFLTGIIDSIPTMITVLVVGFVLGAVGGLIGAAIAKKK